jgi:hydrogenase nickel incorporation protein HypA/HybF
MHELGLINYVVKEATKVAEANHAAKVESVTLAFGEVSGIVTSYLYDYWNWYTKKFPMFDGAKLEVEEIRALTYCGDCHITYDTVKYGKTCPGCGSGRTWLVQGNEMMIRSISIVDNEGDPSDDIEAEGSYSPQ